MLTRLGCAGLAAGLVVAVMAIAPSIAVAGGSSGFLDCQNSVRPECSVGAGSSSSSAGSAPTRAPAGGQDSPTACKDPSGAVIACQRDDAWAGGDGCYYKPTEPSSATVAALGGRPSGAGGWYQRTCYGTDGGAETALGGPVWMASAPAVSPEVVARQAVSTLSLPSVSIVVSPSSDQLVGLPTWLSLAGKSWGSRSATAAVPHMRVTATAAPTQAVWDMGDGSRPVVCHGPGTRWQTGMNPRSSSPTCGHTYRHASTAARGGEFTIRVSVSWQVSWQGAGTSGTVPALSTVGSRRVRVTESQTVVTH